MHEAIRRIKAPECQPVSEDELSQLIAVIQSLWRQRYESIRGRRPTAEIDRAIVTRYEQLNRWVEFIESPTGQKKIPAAMGAMALYEAQFGRTQLGQILR